LTSDLDTQTLQARDQTRHVTLSSSRNGGHVPSDCASENGTLETQQLLLRGTRKSLRILIRVRHASSFVRRVHENGGACSDSRTDGEPTNERIRSGRSTEERYSSRSDARRQSALLPTRPRVSHDASIQTTLESDSAVRRIPFLYHRCEPIGRPLPNAANRVVWNIGTASCRVLC